MARLGHRVPATTVVLLDVHPVRQVSPVKPAPLE